MFIAKKVCAVKASLSVESKPLTLEVYGVNYRVDINEESKDRKYQVWVSFGRHSTKDVFASNLNALIVELKKCLIQNRTLEGGKASEMPPGYEKSQSYRELVVNNNTYKITVNEEKESEEMFVVKYPISEDCSIALSASTMIDLAAKIIKYPRMAQPPAYSEVPPASNRCTEESPEVCKTAEGKLIMKYVGYELPISKTKREWFGYDYKIKYNFGFPPYEKRVDKHFVISASTIKDLKSKLVKQREVWESTFTSKGLKDLNVASKLSKSKHPLFAKTFHSVAVAAIPSPSDIDLQQYVNLKKQPLIIQTKTTTHLFLEVFIPGQAEKEVWKHHPDASTEEGLSFTLVEGIGERKPEPIKEIISAAHRKARK